MNLTGGLVAVAAEKSGEIKIVHNSELKLTTERKITVYKPWPTATKF